MNPSTIEEKRFACRHCTTAGSFKGERNRMPRTCPTLTRPDVAGDSDHYMEAERYEVMRIADEAPFTEDRVLRSRVEELIFFSQGRGFQKLGIAFCVSMLKEAQELARRLEEAELATELVCCRVGAIDYDKIGLPKAHPERFAAICNPAGQARLLNERGVDLVVQMGLCLGHDLILQEESTAPVTTLVVKDRVFDHNPMSDLRKA